VIAYSPNERRQEISAPVDGIVEKWYVLEGMRVAKGERIVDIADNDPEILTRLNTERDAAKRRVDASREAVQTARKNVDRQSVLLAKGLSSPVALETARINLNRLMAEEAGAVGELARIEVRLSRQLTQSVTAPIDGYISQIIAGQGGQLVKGGAPLAVLIPDTESRAVELLIDGNDMPLVSVGRQVRLQFEGWPVLQFSGWPSVAVGTFGGRVGIIDAADNGQGQFRIVVFPVDPRDWPDSRFLRQGVRVRGWILLDTVRVGYELWRIFNGFPPSLQSKQDEQRR
jgi:multidrug efflux pump subunit AcrA (membrane-fusion protein)